MVEQCKDCPWLDIYKRQCRRKAPRFCMLDTSENAGPSKELLGAVQPEAQHEAPLR
jgi:hypothetical protein